MGQNVIDIDTDFYDDFRKRKTAKEKLIDANFGSDVSEDDLEQAERVERYQRIALSKFMSKLRRSKSIKMK